MLHIKTDLSKTLRRIPCFAELEQTSLNRLAEIAILHEIEPGELLFSEGDREDFLFILLEGQITLEIEVPTRGQVLFYTAESLDIIGWSSMTPIVRQRTASARAARHSQLIGFQSKLLQQLCEEDHEVGYIIMRRVANVVANRLLTIRVHLMDMISNTTRTDKWPVG